MPDTHRHRLCRCPKGRISSIALAKDWQLEQVAARANLSLENVQSLDEGNTGFTKRVERIADALQVPISVLLDETCNPATSLLMQLIDAVGDGEEFAELRQEARELMFEKSVGHPEVEAKARRLRKLCKMSGQRTFQASMMIWQCLIIQGNLEVAEAFASELFASASTDLEAAHAARAVAECDFYRGDLGKAANELGGPQIKKLAGDESMTELLGLSPYIPGAGHAAMASAAVGQPRRADEMIASATRYADEIKHLPSRFFAGLCDATASVFLDEPSAALRKARSVLDLDPGTPTRPFDLLATIIVTWGQARIGNEIDQEAVFDAYAELRRHRGDSFCTLWPSLMGDALWRAGQPWMGRHLLLEAERAGESCGESVFLSENLRLQGELLSEVSNRRNDALELFSRAHQMASGQGAHLFALRSLLAAHRVCGRSREKAALSKKIASCQERVDRTTNEAKHADRLLRSSGHRPPRRPK